MKKYSRMEMLLPMEMMWALWTIRPMIGVSNGVILVRGGVYSFIPAVRIVLDAEHRRAFLESISMISRRFNGRAIPVA